MPKKQRQLILQIIAACLYVAMPLRVSADPANFSTSSTISTAGMASGSASFAPILITEVQAGSKTSASEEFIELYNQSSQAITFATSQWQIQITSSKATSWVGPYRTIILNGTIAPGGYYLLASSYRATGATSSYLSSDADGTFSAGLSSDSGHIRLTYDTTPGATASQVADDQIEWTTSVNGQAVSPSIDGYTQLSLDEALAGGSSIKRHIGADGLFASTKNNMADFLVSPCPSPTGAAQAGTSTQNQGVPSVESVVTGPSLAPLPTTVDATNQACIVATPTPDPGATSGNLDGLTTPVGDPPTAVVPPAETTDDQVVDSPDSSEPSLPPSDIGLAAPQLTELLPNPAAPLTDANDEFIELYNSNAQPFDLGGFALETGAKTKHHFVFPIGTTLQPHSFVAFFSSTTNIALSNSGGQVSLLDPLGTTIGQTDTYPLAKDGQAWAFSQGAWQWTITPTPNAANAIVSPIAIPKSSVAGTKKTVNKSTTVAKKAAPKSSAIATTPSSANSANSSTSTTPLHPAVLALAALFAVLYGAYEYRSDLANRIYQFRRYRAYRRENRRSFAWRRGD